MYTVSQDYINAILKPSRTMKPLILINGVALDESNIIEFSIDTNLGTNGLPGIGGAVSSNLKLKFLKGDGVPDKITNNVIDVFISILDEKGIWNRIPLGSYEPQVDNVQKTELSVEIDCLDLLAYYSDKSLFFEEKFMFPSNAFLVLKEIETHTKLFFDLNEKELSKIIIKEKPKENIKIRAFLGKIAETIGANVVISRESRVKFVKLTKTKFNITPDNYIEYKKATEERSYITRLIIEKGYIEKNEQGIEIEVPDIVVGATDGFIVRLENQYINDKVHAEEVFAKSNFPLTYWGYDMTLQGMPHIDVGDIITVTDRHNTTEEIIVISHNLIYKGGLISTFNAAAPSKDINNTTNSGESITDTIHKEIEELKENIVFYENNIEIKAKTRSNTLLQEMVILCKDKDAKAMASYSSCLESNNYGIIEFLIEINGDLELFKPKKTVDTGFNIVSFEMPLRKLRTDIANKVEVRMFADNTSFSIMPSQQQVIVRGTKIESGGNKDLPFTGGEHIEIVKLKPLKLTVKAHTEASISSQLKLAKRQDIERKEIVKVVPAFVINLKGDKKDEQPTT